MNTELTIHEKKLQKVGNEVIVKMAKNRNTTVEKIQTILGGSDDAPIIEFKKLMTIALKEADIYSTTFK